MTLWHDDRTNGHQRMGVEPDAPPTLLWLTIRPCSSCARPVALRRPGVLGVRVPVYCRSCRASRRAWKVLCDVISAAMWGIAIWALYTAFTWLGGAR